MILINPNPSSPVLLRVLRVFSVNPLAYKNLQRSCPWPTLSWVLIYVYMRIYKWISLEQSFTFSSTFSLWNIASKCFFLIQESSKVQMNKFLLLTPFKQNLELCRKFLILYCLVYTFSVKNLLCVLIPVCKHYTFYSHKKKVKKPDKFKTPFTAWRDVNLLNCSLCNECTESSLHSSESNLCKTYPHALCMYEDVKWYIC